MSRIGPPTQEFSQGDGFFLYVDGARHLPDNVTVSRVRLWYMSVAIHMYIMHNAQCTCVLHIAVHMCVMYKVSGLKLDLKH